MSGAQGPSALAPFSYDWIGGDIRGLSGLAGTLYGYAPDITDVASALDSQVSDLVGASGWQGSAAAAFSSAWDKDGEAARAVGVTSDNMGSVIDWLAVRLSQIECDLEQGAADASRHGVAIGPDGAPPGVCYAAPTSSTSAQQAEMEAWTTAYQEYYQTCLNAANRAREEAAGALGEIGQKITGTSQSGMNPGDDNTVGDLLGDLLAVPSANRRSIEEKIGDIRGEEHSAIEEAKASKLSPEDLVDKLASADDNLASADVDLTVAKGQENVISKLLDVRVGDVTDGVNQLLSRLAAQPGGAKATDPGGGGDGGDGADGADGADGVLGKLVDFGEDIPVLDVLAGLVGTGLSTYNDVENGQSLAVALPEEAASNTAGLVTGAVVGSAVATAVGGGLLGGALAVGVAGVVAYGVGDFADNLFHENWDSDVHQYGVVGGVLYGIGDAEVNTGKDFVSVGKDVGHTVAHLWDSMF